MKTLVGLVLIGAASVAGGHSGGLALTTPDSVGAAAGRAASPASRPVLATANIFGAGYGDGPAPGGGGGGTLPPGWRLPAGSARVVTFPSVTGSVTPVDGSAPYHGPQGDRTGSTDIESWRGISGIVDGHAGMFLVGVFLADEEPAAHAPPRLDFTGSERFDTLAPLLDQTFLIGDGGGGRRYEVPVGATRLFVGFADAYNGDFYHGRPGYYGNNAGHLDVAASGVLDGPGEALDTAAPDLAGPRRMTVVAPRRKARVRVRFSISAMDAVDGRLPVTCTPASGSFFKVGRTKVSCSASDSSGNTGAVGFTVTVKRSRR